MASSTDQAPLAIHERPLEELREEVAANADRVAADWPDWKKGQAADSLTSRIPTADEKSSLGFDAGIACSLNMIPSDKQKLSAALHGDYTPERVTQIRRELEGLDPDSETAWWLSACDQCEEDAEIDEAKFRTQLKMFEEIASDPGERLKAATRERTRQLTSFTTENEFGIPYGEKDGCIQGAYVAGYPFGTQWNDHYGIYFIGTYNESLGLEDFDWEDPDRPDEKHQGNSGPVFGSRQFIKCANKAEFQRALEVVKAKFPDWNSVEKQP